MLLIQKRSALRIFLVLEVVVFVWSYIFGSHGWYAIVQLSCESKKILMTCKRVESEIVTYEKKIALVTSDDFFIEKIAREKLQMAKSGETIFYYED